MPSTLKAMPGVLLLVPSEVLTPRRTMKGQPPKALFDKFTDGSRFCRLATETTCCSSRFSPLYVDRATGVLKADSLRFSAVTTSSLSEILSSDVEAPAALAAPAATDDSGKRAIAASA